MDWLLLWALEKEISGLDIMQKVRGNCEGIAVPPPTATQY